MIVIRINGWREGQNWNRPTGWYVRDFARRLADVTNLQKRDREAMAKRILRGNECAAILLPKAKDRFGAVSLRHFLETFGADITIEEPLA